MPSLAQTGPEPLNELCERGVSTHRRSLPSPWRSPRPKPQVALATAAWGGPAMRRPSLHGAGEFVSATWEMINGNFFECAKPPLCIVFARFLAYHTRMPTCVSIAGAY